MDESNEFEKIGNGEVERAVPPNQDFEKAFAKGDVPEFAGINEAGIPELSGTTSGAEFAGDKYGVANPENAYYGEANDDTAEIKMDEQFNAGIVGAAGLINYGLNAAARDLGVETVVQTIKGFDASGRADPIGDLYRALGIDTPEEHREIREEAAAAATDEAMFRDGINAPTQTRSAEGALEALASMKELISEVEGADPRYESLREEARSAGKGYFEYAVSKYNKPGLTELFGELAAQGGESANSVSDITSESTINDDVKNTEEKMLDSETELELADGILDVSTEDKALEKELTGATDKHETLNPEILTPEE